MELLARWTEVRFAGKSLYVIDVTHVWEIFCRDGADRLNNFTGLARVFFFVVIEMFKYSDPLILTADSPFHTTVDVTESA